jgi:hypothetical protein
MALSPFSVTWDYRCPFARNVHEHLVAGLEAGAGWDLSFTAFSLSQVHVHEGEPDVWDDPSTRDGLLAMLAGIVVRDTRPDHFLQVHRALFSARHDEARDIRRPEVLQAILDEQGLDGADIMATVDEGWALDAFRKEHEAAAADYAVFGVPTFITQGRAAFVRIMTRPQGDGQLAIRTIERVVDAVGGWTDLNELKHTSIPR